MVKKRAPAKSKRGPHGYSVPEAGAMIGLSRGTSYEAAKDGTIPTIEVCGLKIVPKAIWLKKLGLDAEASSED